MPVFFPKNLQKSGEARQIINETCQLYRWSSRDRLILDSCLAVSTSDPLCLNPSPAVHLINNLTQNRIRSHPTSIRHTLPLQQTPEFCSSDSSLSKGTFQLSDKNLQKILGPVSVPNFSPKTFQCGTVREVHLKTLLNSRHRQLAIKLTSLPDG